MKPVRLETGMLCGVALLVIMVIAGCHDSVTIEPSEDPVPVITERIADFAPGLDGLLAYDAARDMKVLVVGSPFQTWEWSGDRWVRRSTPHSPPDSAWFGLCSFPAAESVLLLCQRESLAREQIPPEFWAYDGGDWRRIESPAVPPNPGGVLAYDSLRGRLLYTGGMSDVRSRFHDDFAVWAYDGGTWTEQPLEANPPYSPYNVTDLRLGFDAGRDRLVLHARNEGSCGWYSWNFYEYDHTSWAFAGYSDFEPPGEFVYDDQLQALLLLKSDYYYYFTTTVYRYDAGQLTLLEESRGFQAVGSAAYDSRAGVAVTYRVPETMTWSVDSGWRFERPETMPGNFRDGKAAWCESLGGIAVVAANACRGNLIETWLWDGTRYTLLREAMPMPISGGPPLWNVYYGTLVDDPARSRLLLFVPPYGVHNSLQVWAFSDLNWQRLDLPLPRPMAMYFSVCRFPERDSFIVAGELYGGDAATPIETWEFLGESFRRIDTSASPPVRQNAAMVYNAERRTVILFGGYSDFCLNDTWEFNGRDWRLLPTASSPLFRDSAAMVYDEAAGRIVLVGGRCNQETFDDVWEFAGGEWRQRIFEGPAVLRSNAAAAYDSIRRVTVIAGGLSGEETHGSLYELSYH